MATLQPATGSEYQKEYQKIRTKRVIEILRTQSMTQDDFVFLENFVKTYFPDAHKALKNVLTQEALKKVFQGTQYKELEANEDVLTGKDFTNWYVLVLSGKVDISEDSGAGVTNTAVKSYGKGEVVNPNDLASFSGSGKALKATCTEKTEVLMYEKQLYDDVVKEFASATSNGKIRGVAKNFLKIKKMDRSSKEEFLTYFKEEKFTKGTVIVNIKSKIEEIYLIQTGKVVLCVPNDNAKQYPESKLVIGVLGPESLFNEWMLLFEKAAPYYAICMEDVELLSVNKTNLANVTDPETLNDLRANCQSKQRLQSSFLEKYAKDTKDGVEKSQVKICSKAGISLQSINDIFEKFDPKSKTSLQFVKNLEKFNKSVGKPTMGGPPSATGINPLAKLAEFATPRLVSKDPNFRNLDPTRQLALMKLRNEGASRREGGTAIPSRMGATMNKDDIIKMQSRLLREEKAECDRIVQKKTIGEKLGINKIEQEETKEPTKEAVKEPVKESVKESVKDSLKETAVEEKKSGIGGIGIGGGDMFSKMRMGNDQLLAKFKFAFGAPAEEPAKPSQESAATNTVTTNTSTGSTESALGVGQATQANQEVKEKEPFSLFGKPNESPDDIGLMKTQGKLANLLGVTANPKIRPQADIISKKRTNLLKNPNLL